MGDAAAAERLRAGPEGYLHHLADHLENPEAHPFEAIAAALQGESSLMPMAVGHPAAQAGERLRGWVDSLRARDPEPWAKLLAGMLNDPVRMRSPIGTRLKALSPFAGKALVTIEMRYGSSELGGDVSALFAVPLQQAGFELKAGDRYVLALEPDVVASALVVRTRKMAPDRDGPFPAVRRARRTLG